MNRDIITYMIEKQKISGKNLIHLSQVNKYFEKSCCNSILKALKEEFHIVRINKWQARKLYSRMYQIKKDYDILLKRFDILNQVEQGVHDDRPKYDPEYLYNLLYSKYNWDAFSFLSSTIPTSVETDTFYDNINVLIENKLPCLSSDEANLIYGSQIKYKLQKKYETANLKDAWFYELKNNMSLDFSMHDSYMYRKFMFMRDDDQEYYRKTNRSVEYIDDLWYNSINILTVEKYTREDLVHHIHTSYKSCIIKLRDYPGTTHIIEICKKEKFKNDIYKLSRKELSLLLQLHYLFSEGVLSITFPLALLKIIL